MRNNFISKVKGDKNMENTYPEYPKRYEIIWNVNVTDVELQILLEEWQGYFDACEAQKE
tara:strand:- start:400 stop:576 length:177 start_codon:yes stop_codon:yes gene_type:complete